MMSPEKKDEGAAKPPPLIHRVGTHLKIGILGLPNVGKSTFFNVLTKNAAPAENFPFCTIDPNHSKVPVPDKRWEFLCDFYQPPSKVPAYLHVVDIAALVKGAHEGKGLGNAFLSNINACDAMFHVVRAFSDEEIVHVEGEVDPARDLQIIYDELRLKDLEYLKKHIERLDRYVTQEGEDKKKEEYGVLKKVEGLLEDNKWVRVGHWDAKEVQVLNQHMFLTSKPVIYLVNLSEQDYIHNKNEWLVKIKEWVDGNDPGALVIPMSCGLELKLTQMASDEERENYLKEVGTTSTLDKIILDSHEALNLVHYFTSGKHEVRAWTIQVGTKAPAAAGRIHTDFEKGFIMAEVMNFQDFKEAGSEAACKAAGKHYQREHDYIVEDGDIIVFKFNTGQG